MDRSSGHVEGPTSSATYRHRGGSGCRTALFLRPAEAHAGTASYLVVDSGGSPALAEKLWVGSRELIRDD